MVQYAEYSSPLGKLLLTGDGLSLTGLYMGKSAPRGAFSGNDPVLEQAKLWLDAYFRGEDPALTFSLNPCGTEFQKLVWSRLLEIPKGCVRTYGDIGKEIARIQGREKMSAQAVGRAVGHNPISMIIPCHRVMGANGNLTGYAWGLDKKIWLLRHEGWLKEETHDHQ